MSIIPKNGIVRLAISASTRALSTAGSDGAATRKANDPNRILVQEPVKVAGPRQSFWSWLKDYIRHTIDAIKLSYYDGKYLSDHRKDSNATLSEIVKMHDIRSNLYKLIPFSFFIIVPFAELLIPVYLVFYQKAVPSRFLTQKGIDRTNHRISLMMLSSHKKIKALLPQKIEQLKDISSEEQQAITIMLNWLNKGFNYSKDSEHLSKVSPVFEKHVRPLINSDGVLLREYMFAVGLLQATGLYYLNSLFKLVNLKPVTMGSPYIRCIFKFYPRIRINKRLRGVDTIDDKMTKEGIDGLTSNQTVELATKRAIVPLNKTELELKNELKEWHKHKKLELSTFFMTFLNICGKHIQ
jgi:LETM1 and EF-hand domain-containing protein 1